MRNRCCSVPRFVRQFGLDHYGSLNRKSVADSFNAVLADSRAANMEMGGIVMRKNTDNSYVTLRVAGASGTDNCFYYMPTIRMPAGYTQVAYFHTHPDPDGTHIKCRITGDTLTVGNQSRGGGSVLDWAIPTSASSLYTIDPIHLFRLDAGVDPANRPYNTNLWDRNANGCPLR